MPHFAGLSKTTQARLQRLADAAGRTPHDTLKYVLRDSFEQTEQRARLGQIC